MKKGEISFNTMMWVPRLVFLVLVLLAIFYLTISYSTVEIRTWQTESEILAQRILYSPHGISYHDPLNNRIYPGIIDIDKIKNNLLEDSIFYGLENKHIGAKITITNKDTNTVIADPVYNDLVYQRIAEEGRIGKGGVDVSRKQLYVLVKEKEKFTPALAEITVVVPRS